jgi:hypothetical protein
MILGCKQIRKIEDAVTRAQCIFAMAEAASALGKIVFFMTDIITVLANYCFFQCWTQAK